MKIVSVVGIAVCLFAISVKGCGVLDSTNRNERLDKIELITSKLLQEYKDTGKVKTDDLLSLAMEIHKTSKEEKNKGKDWYIILAEIAGTIAAGAIGYLFLGRPIRLGFEKTSKGVNNVKPSTP